jgi:hypothetical protein
VLQPLVLQLLLTAMQLHQQQPRLLQPQKQQQQHSRPTPSCARSLPQQQHLHQQSISRMQPICLLSLASTKAALQVQLLLLQAVASRSWLQLL